MTGYEMCQYVVDTFKAHNLDLKWKTAKEMWEASPRGELFHVQLYYHMAKSLEGYDMQVDDEGWITWTKP